MTIPDQGFPFRFVSTEGDRLVNQAEAEDIGTIDQRPRATQDAADGTVMMARMGSDGFIEFMPSSIIEEDAIGDVASSKRVASPKFQISNFEVINNGNNIRVDDLATQRSFIPIAYELTSEGTGRAFREATGVIVPTPAAANTSEEFTGNVHQFAITNVGRGWANSYTFQRSAGAPAVDDINITIRYQNHSGPIAFDYKQRNDGGGGFSFAENTSGAIAPVLVTLPDPAFFEAGVDIYVTISAPAGSELAIRGQTFPLPQPLGSQEIPSIVVMGRVATVTPIADVQDIINALVNGTHRGITVTGSVDGGGNPIVNLSVGATPPPARPSITALSISNQDRSVAPDTQLTGEKVFSFNVMLSGQVDGTLTLSQDGTNLATGIAPTATSTTATITTVTLAAGQSITFTLSGMDTDGNSFSRDFVIRAAQPHEFAYWGIRATDDFTTIGTSELTSVDITQHNSFEVTGAFASGHVVGVLVPANMDIQQIRFFGQPSIDEFTRTENVRTIGTESYHLYTLTNEGTLDGSAAYLVEVRDA